MTFALEPDDLQHLADLLGQTDAVFAPVREWAGGAWASNAFTARRVYADCGVRWDVGGGTAADRKRQQRWIEEAAGRGLVERFAGGAYSTRCRLTESAELLARVLCGLPGLSAAASLVREVGRYEYADPRAAGLAADDGPGVWVPEWPELSGGEGTDHRLTVERMAYPALARGWVAGTSDVRGLVRYRVGAVPLPATIPADPPGEYDPAAGAAYAGGFRRRLAALSGEHEDPRQLGAIPLPVGWGAVRLKATN